MTWIRTVAHGTESPVLIEALVQATSGLPPEYLPERRREMRLPEVVANDSIVLSHSLIPEALKHVFAAYGAMVDPSLPLSRREQELITTTVSALNRCFY